MSGFTEALKMAAFQRQLAMMISDYMNYYGFRVISLELVFKMATAHIAIVHVDYGKCTFI